MSKLKLISIFIIIILCFSSNPAIRATYIPCSTQCKIKNVSDFSSDTNCFFTENKGQWNTDLLFIGDTPFGKIGFGKNAIYYNLIKIDDKLKNSFENNNLTKESLFKRSVLKNKFDFIDDKVKKKIRVEGCIVKLIFENSNNIIPIGESPLPHLSNYLYGNDPKKWISGAKSFSRVVYKNLYNNLDLVYFFNNSKLKYEFHLRPEADINDIKMNVNGGDIDLIRDCNNRDFLLINTNIGYIKDSDLISYTKQSKEIVDIGFTKYSKNTYGFKFNSMNSLNNGYGRLKEEIIIDPLIYSTFVGGSEDDNRYNLSISVDSQGNAYVCGATSSPDFPTTPGAYDRTLNDDYGGDVFVFKLNSSGSKLIYSTLVGGSGYEIPSPISVDSQGNAYVCGETDSPDFPTTPGAYDRTYNGGSKGSKSVKRCEDVFVFKLNSSGSKLIYSTYIGTNTDDEASSIFVDSQGNAYVCGETISPDFPTTPGAYDRTYNGGDGFVLKLNSQGSKLIYSTYIGGSSYDSCRLISVDSQGNAYVCGETISPDFPTTPGAYDRTLNDIRNSWLTRDMFILELNSSGSKLIYSTYIGTNTDDEASSIFVDSQGNAYICGATSSPDFPTTPGAYDRTYNGGSTSEAPGDGFVLKLNSQGSKLIYSTYIGGSNWDGACSIFVDSQGNAYICGATSSPDFPTTPGAYDRTLNDIRNSEVSGDVFILKFNSSGSKLIYSTLVGGSETECARSIFVDSQGNAYVCGSTTSSDFPTTPGAYDRSFNNNSNNRFGSYNSDDVFVLKLDIQSQSFSENSTIIILKVGDPYMTVNGTKKEIDPGRGTKPVIIKEWGRTLLPIRAIIETLSGTVNWDSVNSKVSISLKSTNIELWINKPMATVNGTLKWIDDNNHNVTPLIINGRTFVPIRFVAENLGCSVDWEPEAMIITIEYAK